MPLTPNLGLNKQANGALNWDGPLNTNFDLLDALFPGGASSDPAAADGIQFVKNGGADAKNGFSWGNAKTNSVAGLSSAHSALPSAGGLIHCAGNATFASDPFTALTKNVQILIVNGVWTFNANATCPVNVAIRVMKGASISVATGVTVNLGAYIDDNYSTVSLAGTGALNQKYSGHEIFAVSYGVKANTKRVTNASTTIGSGIVTVPAAQFTSADVGKTAWAQFSDQAAIIVASTISTVNSSTSITLSNNAGSTNSGNVTLIWGTDDSNALIAAYAAAKNAGTTGGGQVGGGAVGSSRARLILPAGLILFAKQIFRIDGATEFAQVEIVGQGPDITVFVPSVGFVFPAEAGLLSVALNAGSTVLRNFGVDCQKTYFTAWPANNTLGFTMIIQGTAPIWDLHLTRASTQQTVGRGLLLLSMSTAGARSYNLRIEGAGVLALVVGGSNIESYGLEVANNGGAGTHEMLITGASDFHWFGGLLDEAPANNELSLENAKRIVLEGVRVVSPAPATANAIKVDATSSVVMIGSTIFGGSLAQGDGLDVAAGGEARILASRFEHQNATGFAINNAGTVYDLGGNVIDAGKYNGNAVITEFGGTVQGKRLISKGASLVAGDLALAGWGSSATVDLIEGSDGAVTFRVNSSGTGQTANPTIIHTDKDGTWTLTPVVAVLRSGGNQLTVRDTWTRTATALTITFNGTPVAAETYVYVVVKLGR